MQVLILISTVSAAVAALAALGALVIAWKTLKEGRDAIAELRNLRTAAQQETAATQETTQAARRTTQALHLLLRETRIERELHALRAIAGQISSLASTMRLVRETTSPGVISPYWREWKSVQAVLASQVAAAQIDLPHSAALASPTMDPRLSPYSETALENARQEVKGAIAAASQRLADLVAEGSIPETGGRP